MRVVVVALFTVLAVHYVVDAAPTSTKKPNIVFILVDDLGFMDVSMNGQNQLETFNMDSIARRGQHLLRAYVNPVCSPTRGSIMSGRSVLHTGIVTPFAEGRDVTKLNISYTLLPQRLKDLGYATHMSGKWHLGMTAKEYWPSARGFDRTLVYPTGVTDYFGFYDDLGYGVAGESIHLGGSDFGMQPGDDVVVADLKGNYSTDVFTDAAVQWMGDHFSKKPDTPLFLYLAYQGIHSANNKYVQAPADLIALFKNISATSCGPYTLSKDCTRAEARRSVLAAITAVDRGVGRVLAALEAAGELDNTYVVLSNDNGGPVCSESTTDGGNGVMYNSNCASNYPLRGCKAGYFDGGMRAASAVMGPSIPVGSQPNEGLFHVVDWFPTILRWAGGNTTALPSEPPFLPGDGVDQSAMLEGTGSSARTEIPHVTTPTGDTNPHAAHAMHIRKGAVDYKLVQNPQSLTGWYLPPSQSASYDGYIVSCGAPPADFDCSAAPCVFNLTADPCEHVNIADTAPDVLAELQARLATYREHAVYPWADYAKHTPDPRGSPSNFPGTGLHGTPYNASWHPFLTAEEDRAYYPTNYTVPPPNRL